MRALVFLLLIPLPAKAEIRTLEACAAAIEEDADGALSEAARWITLGGGAAARLCEASALQALGADRLAAMKLTELAQDPGVALSADERAVLFIDASAIWRADGQALLAKETADRAVRLTPHVPGSSMTLNARDARLALAWAQSDLGEVEQARALVTDLLRDAPDDPDALALRAALPR